MSDRELLELAAKVAGATRGDWGMNCFWLEGTEWNPLTDDGDALRLAVKLDIDLVNLATKHGTPYGKTARAIDFIATEHFNSDPYAATRRAIVRAAAEIGRNMK